MASHLTLLVLCSGSICQHSPVTAVAREGISTSEGVSVQHRHCLGSLENRPDADLPVRRALPQMPAATPASAYPRSDSLPWCWGCQQAGAQQQLQQVSETRRWNIAPTSSSCVVLSLLRGPWKCLTAWLVFTWALACTGLARLQFKVQ